MLKSFLAAVLLSASVERVGVSRMRDFFCIFWNLCNFFGIFCTLWVFWAFYAAVLLRFRFVVIYSLFRENIFDSNQIAFFHA